MKKATLPFVLTVLLFVIGSTANSQVLISLLLGDKLNSDKLEFGLDGGINYLNMSNSPGDKYLFDWNLGFYFDFKIKPKLFIHTGVIVKSKMGTAGIAPYSLNNPYLDSAFVGGTVDRKLNYFNVPVLLRYRFIDYFHIEGGIQLGLRYKSYDYFSNEIYNEDDLTFKNYIEENYTLLDAGGVVGLGYKLKHGQGITIGVRYYYGFVDVDKVSSGSQCNSAFYINGSIPIGKGKAEKKREEAESQQAK